MFSFRVKEKTIGGHFFVGIRPDPVCVVLVFVPAAPAGGGPVADGGGVRQGSDAEEAGVSEQRGQEAARPADAAGRPAVQRNLPQPGDDFNSLQIFTRLLKDAMRLSHD